MNLTDTSLPSILDDEIVEALQGLAIRPPQQGTGRYTGMHRSRRFGSSIEFAEHKNYTSGDELKHIDWRAYAKTDKLLIKRYEDETTVDIWLVIDRSPSMHYRSQKTKTDVAKKLAIALSYLAVSQGDRVAGVTYSESGQAHLVSPTRQFGELEHLFHIHQNKTSHDITLASSLSALLQHQPKHSLLVLLSDFFEPLDKILPFCERLKEHGNSLHFVRIHHPDELFFPFEQATTFKDMEGSGKVQVYPQNIRQRYLQEFEQFENNLIGMAKQLSATHQRLTIAQPLQQQLKNVIAQINLGQKRERGRG